MDQDNLKLFSASYYYGWQGWYGLIRVQFLNAMSAKISKKMLWLELLEKSCLISSS